MQKQEMRQKKSVSSEREEVEGKSRRVINIVKAQEQQMMSNNI
ncbi:unnamed protein product [Paramecium sonneborni]|uniref:Uncharacterized protein n=1 Tax=Paramecium sonneborni TaxID=65129 RepID=A0A8S1RWX3_9CILI|nr:unnamed protein product [Paramecium sonneborni]CAD8131329.1 unnamed protein product [Paramecium sonneborni]